MNSMGKSGSVAIWEVEFVYFVGFLFLPAVKPAGLQVVFGLLFFLGGTGASTVFYYKEHEFGGKGVATPLPQLFLGHRSHVYSHAILNLL